MIIRLTAATLFPVFLSGIFTFLQRKTAFSKMKENVQQAVIGVAFGLFAILSTQYGVPLEEGVVMNVRDSAPLCAGLLFGGPAGFLAGLIGGMYRWLCVYWGGGMLTRTACALSTFLAGVFSGLMRRQLFEERHPGALAGLGIGATMEVLHMLLILATNLGDVSHAFAYVQVCAFPMSLCNGIALFLAAIVCGFSREKEKVDVKNIRISYDFAFWLLVCVVVAFFVTSSFTQQVVYRITTEDAELYRNVTLYLVVFMEVLIYTALFILIYQLLKKKVVCNLQKVNEGLNAITNGNLDTVIDVRAYREFSELSDDVNATVGTLKHYIKEAEERIDQELEFAKQIQHSALPSVFPPFPTRKDFELYASMDTAKEVGGDFYDFYLLDRFTLIFLIADVSGKGIPAAMFMMRAKTVIRDLAESGMSVEDVFTEANRKLCEGNDAEMFLTAWMGSLDLRSGMLTFVNAGHNPPLVYHQDGHFEYLRVRPNFILAGMDMTRYRAHQLQLEPGDMIYLYTDGVTEAMNESGELYGEERLEALLDQADSTKCKSICDMVAIAVRAFAGQAPQADDITMLCVKLNAKQDKTQVTVRPDEASAEIMQTFLTDRIQAAGVPERVQHRMLIALDEIWSNIIRCSKASEGTLRLSREGDIVYMDFEDNGVAFDPTAVPDADTSLALEERGIGGLGLHMVRKLTTSMEYIRKEEKNHLKLGFILEKE